MSNFVIIETRSISASRPSPATRSTYSLDEAAQVADVHPELVRYYCRLGLFGSDRADSKSEPVFDDDAVYELRRIEHYRRHYGVNRSALPLISRLLHEVARLEAEVRFRGTP
jgi:DNA-binding transcriptional MerR regulator